MSSHLGEEECLRETTPRALGKNVHFGATVEAQRWHSEYVSCPPSPSQSQGKATFVSDPSISCVRNLL